jgi:hypothetical protein
LERLGGQLVQIIKEGFKVDLLIKLISRMNAMTLELPPNH